MEAVLYAQSAGLRPGAMVMPVDGGEWAEEPVVEEEEMYAEYKGCKEAERCGGSRKLSAPPQRVMMLVIMMMTCD
eukprot:CAMPEP_0117650442 /NCGR_PEP_ID=MMETSP0804-20121206/1541_1 /TAXON_ID=1074897 /ORGANISM="Tetraselmis astigmatica, Strain CCMP880" /LENGTH=74 /DNA_ID=CAMNT_0005456313 /DNA_START=1675 /DNA_END=1900 /DNA_ORIENTATION=+